MILTPTRFLNYAQGRSLLAPDHKALLPPSLHLSTLSPSPPPPPPSLCALFIARLSLPSALFCVCVPVWSSYCVCVRGVCRPSFSSPPYLYYLPSYKSRKLTPRPSLSYPQLILRFISDLLSLLSDPSILFPPLSLPYFYSTSSLSLLPPDSPTPPPNKPSAVIYLCCEVRFHHRTLQIKSSTTRSLPLPTSPSFSPTDNVAFLERSASPTTRISKFSN